MTLRTPSLRRAARWVPALCLTLALVLLAGCAGAGYPQTTLAPKADFAELLDQVFRRSFQLATIVFFLVEGALVWALFRFRGKPGDAEPAQTHGNAMLEVVWTVIPAVILVFIAIPTIQTIFKTASVPTDNPLVIEVTGHQWWWEFRYPEYNLVTAGDMHVPTGRTVDLRMTTGDVVHSFWTPQLAGKRDVFPKRDNRLWFKTETAGTYPGQCAEFCGTQHARMAFQVIAQDPASFDAWRAGMAVVGDAAGFLGAGPEPAGGPGQAALHHQGMRRLSYGHVGRRSDDGRPQPGRHRQPDGYRLGLAPEHRREPGPLAAQSAGGQGRRADAQPRAHR